MSCKLAFIGTLVSQERPKDMRHYCNYESHNLHVQAGMPAHRTWYLTVPVQYSIIRGCNMYMCASCCPASSWTTAGRTKSYLVALTTGKVRLSSFVHDPTLSQSAVPQDCAANLQSSRCLVCCCPISSCSTIMATIVKRKVTVGRHNGSL